MVDIFYKVVYNITTVINESLKVIDKYHVIFAFDKML